MVDELSDKLLLEGEIRRRSAEGLARCTPLRVTETTFEKMRFVNAPKGEIRRPAAEGLAGCVPLRVTGTAFEKVRFADTPQGEVRRLAAEGLARCVPLRVTGTPFWAEETRRHGPSPDRVSATIPSVGCDSLTHDQ
jgi:hypothetical protein